MLTCVQYFVISPFTPMTFLSCVSAVTCRGFVCNLQSKIATPESSAAVLML